MSLTKTDITKKIKEKALELGFNGVGIARAEKLNGFADALKGWLAKGYHAEMDYMARNQEKRSDPTELVPGVKSVISLITSYYPEQVQNAAHPQIAKYAYGTDYHFVLKDRMKELWKHIATLVPDLEGRIFVDSAPVSDKLWAVKAGLGWLGKNSCLINKEMGSFVFISELLVNLELVYDEPYASNFCGSCTLCIDACPTQAIAQPGVVDSRRCISYQTIENRNDYIDDDLKGNFKDRIFGCDICQDVCPWNKKPLITALPEFKPSSDFYLLDWEAWNAMDEANFNRLFAKSALKRAKLKGVQRNLRFVQSE
ncbi:MAG: tRNA epoxyqueuosine(34) reductase QueG [Salinivirgaceae bacterium]